MKPSHIHSYFRIGLLGLSLLCCVSCAPVVESVVPPAATPESTAIASPTPVLTPPSQTTIGSAALSTPIPASALDGVADPNDVLPQLSSYTEAKAINSDVIGWLTVPNTQINYPVVRAADNEFYLVHNVEKEESKHGAVFMDYRNAKADQQRHIILYGHNMKNGTMFHDLNNYKQRSFFDANRIITFLWDGMETRWEIYAAYVVKNYNDTYYVHTRFGSDENYAQYMNALIDYAKDSKYSVVDENVTIKSAEQILTLSTCTYEYDDYARFAVSARRIQ